MTVVLITTFPMSSSSSIGVQELLPIPATVIRPGLGACNRCNRCLFPMYSYPINIVADIAGIMTNIITKRDQHTDRWT